MINYKDLRCDNLIYKRNKLFKVDQSNLLTIARNPTAYLPIEISEEILLKVGFELDNENGSLDLISEGLKMQLIDNLGKWLVYISGPFGMVMPKQIYYLHQLQNLIFSLIGKELNTSLL